jgi:hypothetical protein
MFYTSFFGIHIPVFRSVIIGEIADLCSPWFQMSVRFIDNVSLSNPSINCFPRNVLIKFYIIFFQNLPICTRVIFH